MICFFSSKFYSSWLWLFRHTLVTRRIWESVNRSVIDFFWPKYNVVIVWWKMSAYRTYRQFLWHIHSWFMCWCLQICVKDDWVVQKVQFSSVLIIGYNKLPILWFKNNIKKAVNINLSGASDLFGIHCSHKIWKWGGWWEVRKN